MHLDLNAANRPGPDGTSQKSDSGHAGTTSITFRVRRASWNAMKRRVQRVLTPRKPDSMTCGSGTDRHDQLALTGKTVLVMLM